MTWHLEPGAVRDYQNGLSDRVASASAEAHLQGCDVCRRLLQVDHPWLAQSWEAVATVVESPSMSPGERVLGRLGLPSHLARLLMVTPSLRPAWALAVAFVLGFAGLVSSLDTSQNSFDLFLTVLPLIPVLGVALAYGRVGDPAHEMTAATPVDPLRLLLLRTGAVTLVAVVLGAVVDLTTTATSRMGMWLLPTLALTVITLALGTSMSMWLSATVTSGLWLSTLGTVAIRSNGAIDPMFRTGSQTVFSLLILGATVVVVHRRDLYRRGEV